MPFTKSTNLTAGSVVRLRAFTRRGVVNLDRILSVDYKAPKGQHFILLMLGAVPEDQPLTEEWLRGQARAIGLVADRVEKD